MPAQKFILQGRIIDSETQAGMANLKVDAIGINTEPNNKVFTQGTTDRQGNFSMKFTDLDLRAYFGRQPSPLFFNIFQDDFLLESTRDSQTWTPDAGGINRITLTIARTDETFIVQGRIVTRDGSPPDQVVAVRAFKSGSCSYPGIEQYSHWRRW